MGFSVVRDASSYASTDGKGRIFIGSEDLDPDDCLAQMIFHELCHSLIFGIEGFEKADWGFPELSEEDAITYEHATLRLQKMLALRFGLHQVLAPTTGFRSFYDCLPYDPFLGDTEEIRLAKQGWARYWRTPWNLPLEAALLETARIAKLTHARAPQNSIWTLRLDHPARHPAANALLHPSERSTCDTCMHFRDERFCSTHQIHVSPNDPVCELYNTQDTSCLECAACCRAAYDEVIVEDHDPCLDALTPHLRLTSSGLKTLPRMHGLCVLLEPQQNKTFECRTYEQRPLTCRNFERGSEDCREARRRLGLSR